MEEENYKLGADFKDLDTASPTIAILLNSTTVIERKDNVSSGILTFVEGDMLEVETSDFKKFALGEMVKVIIYTPHGIFTFSSTVIAKDHGSIIVINPPENRKKFAERRIHTRVDIEREGVLKINYVQTNSEMQALPITHKISLNNISTGGIGFTIEGDLTLRKGERIEITVDIGLKLSCDVQIMRTEQPALGIYYGAELTGTSTEQINMLRSFILKSQVEKHLIRKKNNKLLF